QRRVAVRFTDITARKQQERALARLANIVDSSDDAIISKDLDGVVTTWNKAAQEMFGYSEDEAVERSIASLIIPPDRQYEEDDILARLAAGQTVDHFETVRKRKDGSLVNVSATISPLRDAQGQIVGASKIARDITERTRAEKILHASEERSRQILDSAIDYAIIAMDTEGRITLWNEGAHRVLGWAPEEMLGQSIEAIFTPEDVAAGRIAHEMQRARVNERGMDERWHLRKGGDTFRASGEMMPLLDDAGAVVGFVKVVRDRTEYWLANKHRELLVQELNHRVKNTLATIQALARQTFRGPEVREAMATFEARLLAMSAAHDVLTRENWQGAGIREIVDNTITTWVGASDTRIAAEGPQLRLRPSAALTLAMALHELATNASKYGALSNKTGTVTIDWSVSDDPPARFRMEWREQGGPPVQPPSRRGFGSRLIEYGLAQDLGGTVDLAFCEGGVGCTIEAPVEAIREEDAVP
ncbi:MAG: sensor histidine kinase, partial [Rhodanobacteraceae bacterium]